MQSVMSFHPIISYFRKLKTRTFRTNLRTQLFCNTKSFPWNIFGFAANICSRFYYNVVAPHHGRRFPIQKIIMNWTFSYLIHCNIISFWRHVVCLVFLIWHALNTENLVRCWRKGNYFTKMLRWRIVCRPTHGKSLHPLSFILNYPEVFS